MDIYGKADSVLEWAKTWPEFNGYLKLNATTNEVGESSLVTNYTDVEVGDGFLDESAPRSFMFSLNLILDWSDGYDSVNIESMKFASTLLDWVNDQYKDGNFPDFGDAIITGIETDQNLPSVNFVYQEESIAQYTIAARVNYIE